MEGSLTEPSEPFLRESECHRVEPDAERDGRSTGAAGCSPRSPSAAPAIAISWLPLQVGSKAGCSGATAAAALQVPHTYRSAPDAYRAVGRASPVTCPARRG